MSLGRSYLCCPCPSSAFALLLLFNWCLDAAVALLVSPPFMFETADMAAQE